MGKVRVAGICRKSPGKKIEESIAIQQKYIIAWCDSLFGINNYFIDWFLDKSVSRDDPNRPALNNFFESKGNYQHAVSHVVDRFGSGHLPIRWFFEHFTTNDGRDIHKGCRLHFVSEVPELYLDSGKVNDNSFFIFGLICIKAQSELMSTRSRTQRGRENLTVDEWKKKYKGGKLGRTWKKNK